MKKFYLKKRYKSGILLFKNKFFSDKRGIFIKLFSENELKKYFKKGKICQTNFVKTKKIGTFRGFHYQVGQYTEQKLITCIKGKIEVVIIINCNKKSKDYLNKYKFLLSQKKQLFFDCAKKFCKRIFSFTKKILKSYIFQIKIIIQDMNISLIHMTQNLRLNGE